MNNTKNSVDTKSKNKEKSNDDDKKENEENSKKLFSEIKNGIIIPLSKHTIEAFKDSGDILQIYTNERATSLNDRSRHFVQILYFPNGRGPQKVGFNTPSILFECLPHHSKIVLSMRTELKPSPLKIISEINLVDFNEKIVQENLTKFITEVTKLEYTPKSSDTKTI